jgi:hypothetical protein
LVISISKEIPMRTYIHSGLMAAVLAGGFAAPLAAEQAGVQPMLAVTARAFHADGAAGASAGGSDPFVVGKSATYFLYAGRSGQEGGCSLGSADSSARGLDELLNTAAHVWKVTATGVKYEGGKQTFDLEWARYASAAGAVPVVSRKQRLTLAQDQAYTVDLLHNSSGDCRTSSIVVEIAAGVREDPALANTVLHYDVWLVRRSASGKKESRQFVLTGKQGAAVPFAFAPLVGEVPALQPSQYDFSVLTHVSGELRGRIGANGRLSLELTTRREDRLYHPAQDPPSNPGLGAGRKVLDVGEGEAVEIELPARSGYSAHYASAVDAAQGKGTMSRLGAGQGAPASSLPAVSLQNGRVVVSFGPYFANERVSLIVQARKVE